jgi:aminomethyltransferase
MNAEPRQTPLFDAHRRAGARIIDFGGWLMPVSYPSGIIDEHRTTRSAVGIFDVCHMGEVHFRGSRAVECVQRLVTNDVTSLVDGHALYTVACRANGGIVDDLIVYRIAADHFLIVVNASNRDKDLGWFRENVGASCEIVDASDATGLIAFQGPKAELALQTLTSVPLASLRSFDLVSDREIAGVRASIARTGYTAEDGFEIFCDAARAESLWQSLLDAADRVGGKPVGLGARDTLRLEGKLSLYGNDLTEDTTPLEAGLGWVVKLDGPADFIGKAALREQKSRGVRRKLVGFVMRGRGVARHGYRIHAAVAATGQNDATDPVGVVTSGTFGPTIEKNIGMGYVPADLATPGGSLLIDCRGKLIEAEIVSGPFYKRAREQTR